MTKTKKSTCIRTLKMSRCTLHNCSKLFDNWHWMQSARVHSAELAAGNQSQADFQTITSHCGRIFESNNLCVEKKDLSTVCLSALTLLGSRVVYTLDEGRFSPDDSAGNRSALYDHLWVRYFAQGCFSSALKVFNELKLRTLCFSAQLPNRLS